jgi:hypothetical protein
MKVRDQICHKIQLQFYGNSGGKEQLLGSRLTQLLIRFEIISYCILQMQMLLTKLKMKTFLKQLKKCSILVQLQGLQKNEVKCYKRIFTETAMQDLTS